MSILSIGLLVALIAVFIWMKWIRCRLKNYTPGAIRIMGMGGAQASTQSTIQLQIHKKEADQAFKYLADFNK